MKNISKLIIFVFFSIIILNSCESEQSIDVNQDRIYTIYKLSYNANEDITYAEAVFRFGNSTGTLLELTEPSEVRFNDEVLTFNATLALYQLKKSGFVSSGTFTWKDTNEKEFQNSIELREISFPEIDTISISSSFEFEWVGTPLIANESANLWLDGQYENDASIVSETGEGKTTIIIPLSKLENVAVGEGKLAMNRFTSNDLAEKTGAGGRIEAKYRAKDIDIFFAE